MISVWAIIIVNMCEIEGRAHRRDVKSQAMMSTIALSDSMLFFIYYLKIANYGVQAINPMGLLVLNTPALPV